MTQSAKGSLIFRNLRNLLSLSSPGTLRSTGIRAGMHNACLHCGSAYQAPLLVTPSLEGAIEEKRD